MHLCYTTVSSKEDATRLAKIAVESNLCACAQISSPIESIYQWKGEIQTDTEYRIVFKTLESRLSELENAINSAHPYETPQWIAIKATKVSEKYLIWAKEVCTLRRLI